jgi:hypothetical protein
MPQAGPAPQAQDAGAGRFDPLAHDNAYDQLFATDKFRLAGGLGVYTAIPPADRQERIHFYLDAIDRTSETFFSATGYAWSPVSLALLKEGDAARPWIEAAFREAIAAQGKERKVRLLACVLGRLRDDRMFEPLALAAIGNPSDEVRRSACWAMARCGGMQAMPVLVELLEKSPSREEPVDNNIAAAEALSFVTGQSFPTTITLREPLNQSVTREDVQRWREWARSPAVFIRIPISGPVAEALAARRTERAAKTSS